MFFYLSGKPASMSSVLMSVKEGADYPLMAEFGNDGIYQPQTDEMSSLVHTMKERDPWWMVDLKGVYCIWAVRILNRGINLFSFLFSRLINSLNGKLYNYLELKGICSVATHICIIITIHNTTFV